MFTELMPLIQKRRLTITVASVSASQIRVNVVPQPTEKDKKANEQIGYSHTKEVAKIPDEAIQGLTTPLSLTGTPDEIDAELTNALTKFTLLHVELQTSFDAAAAAIKESVKAIDDRERLKKEKNKAGGTKPAAPKAEDKKQTEDTALPLLFTTESQSRPVSANDIPTASASAQPESNSEAESIGDVQNQVGGEDESQ